MRKWVLPLAGIAIAFVAIVIVITGLNSRMAQLPVIFESQGIADSDPSYVVCLEEDGGITADAAYLFIDLSDTTNYAHDKTNAVILSTWHFQGSITGAHEWHAVMGVVVENDATDGTVEFIMHKTIFNLSGIFDIHHEWTNNLDLWIEDEALLYATTSMTNAGTTWQNDVKITSTLGTTELIAAGDVVLFMDEITDGSALDFAVCVEYDTR